MIANIINNQTIRMQNITNVENAMLLKHFTAKHPNAYFMKDSGFDGIYRRYNATKRELPRPLLGQLMVFAKKKDMALSVVDSRPDPKYPAPDPNSIKDNLLPGITLDPHQMRSLKAACKAEVGLFHVPTGGGKTEIMAGIAKIMNCPTVILGDMTVVIDQIKERLELRKVVDEVGLFYAGKTPSGQQIIVGSIQSLNIPSKPERKEDDTDDEYADKLNAYKSRRKNANIYRDIIRKCDLLMIDEADRASSTQYSNVFRYFFKGRRRYGFSGTYSQRADKKLILESRLGSIIGKATRDELEGIDRIDPIKYYMVPFGDESRIKDKMAYDLATDEWMVKNEDFHNKISIIANRETKDGDGCLILVSRKDLGYALEEKIPSSKFICGETSKSQRNKAIKDFEERKITTLIGGKIANRGLDLKGGCETLILATGGKLRSDFVQKIGRAVRKTERGWAKVYDFYFLCNHYLYEHSRDRLKIISSLGYPSYVLFPQKVVEGDQLIKSRFRRPK